MRFLSALLVLAIAAMAFTPEPSDTTKENNPYLQPVTWEGYNVDWSFRSLKVGTPFADSTMADGWLGTYGLSAGVADVDSLNVDTLSANYIYATSFQAAFAVVDSSLSVHNLSVTNDAVIDSMLSVGDSTYLHAELTVNGLTHLTGLMTDSGSTVGLYSNEPVFGAGSSGDVDISVKADTGGLAFTWLVWDESEVQTTFYHNIDAPTATFTSLDADSIQSDHYTGAEINVDSLTAAASILTGINVLNILSLDRITLFADVTAPTVSAGTIVVTAANSVPTAITDLTGPTNNQIVILVGGSDTNSSTIADGGNFNLSAGWTANVDDILILWVEADNDYVELGRVNN